VQHKRRTVTSACHRQDVVDHGAFIAAAQKHADTIILA
jgi:hypothetical protein